MPKLSIIFGSLLVLIGVIGYGYGMSTGHASVTALIPAFFGIVIAICGVISQSNEGLRKHLMHVAITLALIGFLMTAGRLIMKMSELAMTAAVISQVAMAVVCLLLVILGVRSFIDARKNR